ncbi:hypothetical protein QEN19_002545 [Hanseniaspora menglaensis]
MKNNNDGSKPEIKPSKFFTNRELPLPVPNAHYGARTETELASLNAHRNELVKEHPFLKYSQFQPVTSNSTALPPPTRISQQHAFLPNQWTNYVSNYNILSHPLQHQHHNNTRQHSISPQYSPKQISILSNNNFHQETMMLYPTFPVDPFIPPHGLFPVQQPLPPQHVMFVEGFKEKEDISPPIIIPQTGSGSKTKKTLKHNNSVDCKLQLSLTSQNVCKICNKKCQSPSALKIHMVIHSEGKPFKCYYCNNFISKFASNRNRHMKQVHGWDKGNRENKYTEIETRVSKSDRKK